MNAYIVAVILGFWLLVALCAIRFLSKELHRVEDDEREAWKHVEERNVRILTLEGKHDRILGELANMTHLYGVTKTDWDKVCIQLKTALDDRDKLMKELKRKPRRTRV